MKKRKARKNPVEGFFYYVLTKKCNPGKLQINMPMDIDSVSWQIV